ncbi:MAG: PEP/pyruvate-binding domain-containing protein [Bacteroidota bacterium]
MRKICWLTIAFLSVLQGLQAQAVYVGQVRDVSTREVVSGVKVSLLGSHSVAYANASGDFVIKGKIEEGASTAAGTFSFIGNAMVWQEMSDFSFQLYDVQGKKILSESGLGGQGQYLFPRLAPALYVLGVEAGGEKRAYKLLSDGRRTMPVDTQTPWHEQTVSPGLDTLRFEKAGYFPRDLILPRRDTLLNVSLMAGEYDELHYLNELVQPFAYDLLSSTPSRTNVGGIRAVKIIYHEEEDRMYYQNTKRYNLHFSFAEAQLGFRGGNGLFNLTQYRDNPDRYLFPANLNYYPRLDRYVLQLVAINEMSCENIKRLYDKLLETSFFGEKLVFFANRPEWENCAGVPLISSEELYAGQNYQALNLEQNYGYLTKVALEDLSNTYLGRRDIVLLNGIPNDVPVVAGIITSEFQTPLSHINVLSNSRGTPNMALRDGWESPLLDSLIGRLVYLRVKADTFELRAANLDEAEAFWAEREPKDTLVLGKNTQLSGLVDLTQAGHDWVDRIGGKAANFAEMLKVSYNGQPIPVPEDPFAIPFFYYAQHLQQSGLDSWLTQMLADPLFQNSPAYRQASLKVFQDSIRTYPLDPTLLSMVMSRINNFQDFDSYRFRSSTNAEDLENFSGAGLYDSYSGKKHHIKKTVAAAIKKVWASLWNWRAYEERAYYKIDHQSCAMGVLVHRSFPDEDANGVVVTRNLYNLNPGFIINVQYKEYSIVFPEPGIIHDQIMLFLWSLTPGQPFSVEYLSFSNIPELNGQRVMSDAEIFELGHYCMALKQHFFNKVPHTSGQNFDDYALDIEFKVDSEVSPRKVYIKQARIFK